VEDIHTTVKKNWKLRGRVERYAERAKIRKTRKGYMARSGIGPKRRCKVIDKCTASCLEGQNKKKSCWTYKSWKP